MTKQGKDVPGKRGSVLTHILPGHHQRASWIQENKDLTEETSVSRSQPLNPFPAEDHPKGRCQVFKFQSQLLDCRFCLFFPPPLLMMLDELLSFSIPQFSHL